MFRNWREWDFSIAYELLSISLIIGLLLVGGEVRAAEPPLVLTMPPTAMERQAEAEARIPLRIQPQHRPQPTLAQEVEEKRRFQAGDMMVRARVAVVNPDESSSVTPIGGKTHVSTEVLPEVDFTYFLTDHFSLEAISGIIPHKLKIQDTRRGDLDAGRVVVIAPTLVMQYHHEIAEGVKPYIGAGLSYVYYIDDNDDGKVNYSDDVAPVVQAGIDIAVDDAHKWHANLDMKKAWVTTVSSRPNSPLRTETDVDPWVFAAGMGYKF